MEVASVTKKLFHAIVVLGMTSSLGCSNAAPPAPDPDAASSSDSGGNMDSAAVADASGGKDAGGDAFTGWLGC